MVEDGQARQRAATPTVPAGSPPRAPRCCAGCRPPRPEAPRAVRSRRPGRRGSSHPRRQGFVQRMAGRSEVRGVTVRVEKRYRSASMHPVPRERAAGRVRGVGEAAVRRHGDPAGCLLVVRYGAGPWGERSRGADGVRRRAAARRDAGVRDDQRARTGEREAERRAANGRVRDRVSEAAIRRDAEGVDRVRRLVGDDCDGPPGVDVDLAGPDRRRPTVATRRGFDRCRRASP